MRRREFLVAGSAGAAVSAAPLRRIAAAESPRAPEAVIDAEVPIVDPHHHLWDNPGNRYLLPDFLADVNDGHRIVKTVFAECRAMYRPDGPAELRSLGETEFASGVAAMSASGTYGPVRVSAAILGAVDLRIGARAGAVLDRHVAVSDGRFRGIRTSAPWDGNLRMPDDLPGPGVLADTGFRRGLAQLTSRHLSFEIWCFFTQLPEVADLARAFPKTQIVIGHLGGPILTGYYASRHDQVFSAWLSGMRACARLPNVQIKLGGLGMKPFGEFLFTENPPADSVALAESWRPWFAAAIEAFGPARCMLESNFPADRSTCSYRTLWNTFKRIIAPYSAGERAAMLTGTATATYRL